MSLLKKLGFTKRTLLAFMMVVANANLIYSISGIRGVLYNPYLEVLGVSNTELGILLGAGGLLSTFGYIPFGWLQDIISPRKVLAINTVIVGLMSLYIAVVPNIPFSVLLVLFLAYSLCSEPLYWSSYLKSIRMLAPEDKQGTAFGLSESGRSITGLVYQSLSLVVYVALGSTVFGMRVAMVINTSLLLLSGILIWFLMPDGRAETRGEEKETSESMSGRTKEALRGLFQALKMPEVWLTGLSASFAYAIYCAAGTYFVPFLEDVFLLPAALVGVYGLVNRQLVAILAGPLSGIFSDSKFRSSAHWMRVLDIGMVLMSISILVLPKKHALAFPAMVILMVIALFIYLIRSVYFAPIGESGVSEKITASAMAIASTLGYLPMAWAYPLFGWFIDTNEPVRAYNLIFSVLAICAVGGVAATSFLAVRIDRRRASRPASGNS